MHYLYYRKRRRKKGRAKHIHIRTTRVLGTHPKNSNRSHLSNKRPTSQSASV